jgi:D-alanyl-D-alanine endopeptidase (penicillin-binding protein 7)
MGLKKLLTVLLFSWMSVQAESVLVYDIADQTTQYTVNADEQRPMASITKLMTAMVALDADWNLDRRVMLDTQVGSYLPRQTYTRKELLMALLVKSDNAAAETLASDYPGGRSAFVAEMNSRARRMGMWQTEFEDPSGLSRNNVSTARDLSVLVGQAYGYNFIRDVSVRTQVSVETQGKKRSRSVSLANTNTPILTRFKNILVSKTGFTRPAGFCVALMVEENQRRYAVIVLGAVDKIKRLATVSDVISNHLTKPVVKYSQLYTHVDY